MDVITVSCACGHSMKFGADKAGRKAKCPKCMAILVVPKGDAANRPLTEDEQGEGAYGVTVDHELVERRLREEEAEELRRKIERRKKAPKIAKKFKSLPDADLWEKVHFGLLFIFLGTCLWAFSHLLLGTWTALGSVEFTDYSRLVTEQIQNDMMRRQQQNPPEPAIPDDGRFWDFSQFNFLVALPAGRGFVGFAKLCIIVCLLLLPFQTLLWMIGYILCLPVPRHHGALGLLITMMCLNVINFMFWLFFKLLPIVGVYRFYLIPYLFPEVMYTEYNMERTYPFFMLWNTSPFWETLLAMFLQFMQYLEPTLGAIFIWSCACTLKETRLQNNGKGVTEVGLNQYAIWLLFVMFAVCGTTPVLVNVLRILYMLWYGAVMMFITRYALLIWRARDKIDERLNPGG